MHFTKIISTMALVFAVTGCASIVSKSEWPVNVKSEPAGAQITIKDENGVAVFSGKTPTIVTLPTKRGYFKSKTYTIDFKKAGYTQQTLVLPASMNPWYIGNVVFGGLIGWVIVDPLTGAMWKLPAETNVQLSGGKASLDSSSDNEQVSIMMLDEVPANLRSQMIPIN
jgi:DNA-binding beta-propeller fold protein YncE